MFTQEQYGQRFDVTLSEKQLAKWSQVFGEVESLVAGFVGARLDMGALPAAVTGAAMAIMRSRLAVNASQHTDAIQTASDEAMALLRRIASGQISFDVAPTAMRRTGNRSVVCGDAGLFGDELGLF